MDPIQIAILVTGVLCLLLLICVIVLVCAVSSHFMRAIQKPEYITKFIVSLLGKGGGGGQKE